MEVSRAIDLIDNKMCWGRGTFSAHHMPEYDEYWQAGEMAIDALKKQEEGRWHSIAKEGNPKEKGLYIITKKLRDRNGAEMHKVAVDRWSRDGLGKEWVYNSNAFVSAWKPLPEPYTEEE